MKAEEAAKYLKESLVVAACINGERAKEAVRALLAGYEADCIGCNHKPNSAPDAYPCCVCRRMHHDQYESGPEPGGKG